MRKLVTILGAVLSAVTLTACGGGGTGSGVASFAVGPIEPVFDRETGTLWLDGRVLSEENDLRLVVRGDAMVTRDDGNTVLTARAETENAYALAFADFSGSDRPSGAAYGRTSFDGLPMTGGASLRGNYSAVVTRDTDTSGQTITSILLGDTILNIDFEDREIGGSIFNRRVFRTDGTDFPGTTAANITLRTTDLNDDGTFGTRTSQGQFLQSSTTYTPVNGSYVGTLAGSGDSAAGHVQMDHLSQSTGITYRERGAFVAD